MIKQKRDICCSNGAIKHFLILLIFLSACIEQQKQVFNDYAQFYAFFSKYNFSAFNQNTTSILLLDEIGCLSCIESYANLIANYVNYKNTVIVITATGARLDISAFLGDTANNIFFDDRQEFKKMTSLKNSSAIFFHNETIDTIVTIDINNLEEKLEYIDKRLNRK